MVSDETLRYWIALANEEMGYSDRNDITFNYIKNVQDRSKIIVEDDWYIVMMPFEDAWGNKSLSVISSYIKPEARKNHRNFLKIHRAILLFAKEKNIKYIYQGSHLTLKFHGFLEKQGYKIASMVKEL